MSTILHLTQGWYFLRPDKSIGFISGGEEAAAHIRENVPDAICLWPIDPADRETGWSFLVEALALGADRAFINGFARLGRFTDQDAPIYAQRIGCHLAIRDDGLWAAAPTWAAVHRDQPVGTGTSALDALAALCRSLSFKGGLLLEPTFEDLLCADGKITI